MSHPSEEKLTTCTLPDPADEPQTDIPPSAELQAEAKRRAFRFHDWAGEIKKLTTATLNADLHRGKRSLSAGQEVTISPIVKLVATRLADHANSKTGQCNPSHKLVADEIGVSRVSTVSCAIKLLEAIGALNVRHTWGNRVVYTPLRIDAVAQDGNCAQAQNGFCAVAQNPVRTTKRNNEEERGGSRSGSETERACEDANETTTTLLQIVGTREKPATVNQRTLLDELSEERAEEAHEVTTFAEADKEIKRLRALPRVEMMPCTGGDSDNPCGKPAPVTKEMKGDSFAWIVCADCKAWYEEQARIMRSTPRAPKPEPDRRPVVECAVNGCGVQFHADEGEQFCPHCRGLHERANDEIPGFDEPEAVAA